MTLNQDKILAVCERMLKLKDIHACMVARKRMEGIIPDNSLFNPDVMDVWETLQKAMDTEFDLISSFSDFGLGEITFRLQDFEVFFYILPGSDTALIAIVPALANKGLLEVELENARRQIIQILAE
jgi:hypothetical protein